MFPKYLPLLSVPNIGIYLFRMSPFALTSEAEEFIHTLMLKHYRIFF